MATIGFTVQVARPGAGGDTGETTDALDHPGDRARLWLLGLLANVGGGLIHLLLIVAVIVLIAEFLTGRRTSV